MMKSIAVCFPFALLVFAVACGGNEPPPQVPAEPPPPAIQPTDAPTDLPAPDAGAPTASPTPAEKPLTDEQIAKITWTLHQGEIEAGKLAASNAKDAKVKKFAAMMVKHHSDAQKKEEALAKKAKMTPADSPTAAALASQNESVGSTLKGLKGADFDKAYIDAQVKGHQDALATIDDKLMPAVQSADLKSAITSFRPTVEAHLKEAKEIQATLQ